MPTPPPLSHSHGIEKNDDWTPKKNSQESLKGDELEFVDLSSELDPSHSRREAVHNEPADMEEIHHQGNAVSRALSRVTSKSNVTIGPPPDGGLRAWLCVLGTHLVVMNTWGVINSFGVFQSYYVTTLNRTPSEISWIGSIEVFFLFFIGAFTGRLTDAGYFYPVSFAGAVLVVLGTLTTSACTQYWQIFLAQGVCVGLGNGCLFCPSVALISTYFDKRRSFAIGISACGSATGGIVFPVLVRQLLPSICFVWTVRTIGFIQAGTLVLALLCLKPRVAPRKSGAFIEWAAFKELEYTFYAIGAFMCFWGTFFAFFFIAAYSRDIQGMSYTTSLDLLIIMNGVGIIGRLLPNHLADRWGTLTIFGPTAGYSALMTYCWLSISSRAGLYAWAAFGGIAFGAIQALFPAGLASLTTDLSKQGTRIGMIFTIVSFSALTGPPISGALISAAGGRYHGAQLFAGTSFVIGMGFMIAAREAKRRRLEGALWDKV